MCVWVRFVCARALCCVVCCATARQPSPDFQMNRDRIPKSPTGQTSNNNNNTTNNNNSKQGHSAFQNLFIQWVCVCVCVGICLSVSLCALQRERVFANRPFSYEGCLLFLRSTPKKKWSRDVFLWVGETMRWKRWGGKKTPQKTQILKARAVQKWQPFIVFKKLFLNWIK